MFSHATQQQWSFQSLRFYSNHGILPKLELPARDHRVSDSVRQHRTEFRLKRIGEMTFIDAKAQIHINRGPEEKTPNFSGRLT